MFILFLLTTYTPVIPGFGNLATYSYYFTTNGYRGGSGYLFGYNLFYYTGMIELSLIAFSIISLHNLKFRFFVYSGILGYSLISLNFILSFIKLFLFPEYGYEYGLTITLNFSISFLIITIISFFFMTLAKSIESNKKKIDVRKKILNFGIEFTRLEIKEISAKCKEDSELIMKIVKEMVENQEIFGDYFKSSKTLVFNQQANIDQIDDLLLKYDEWEKEGTGKKI